MVAKKQEVFILLKSEVEAKKIQIIFDKIGSHCTLLNDVDDFLKTSKQNAPDMAIIDALLISNAEISLLDHPFIKGNHLPVIFYSEESSKPLLQATYNIFNLGYIQKGDNYEAVLKGILKRVNVFKEQRRIIDQKSFEEKELHLKLKKLESSKRDYQNIVIDLIKLLEENKSSLDFHSNLEKAFNNFDFIKTFSWYELSLNKQKLTSQASTSKHFRKLPNMWLGQACESGIPFFGQNMAIQVALEVIGGDLLTLLIRGADTIDPNEILFLRVKDKDLFNNVDWTLIESYLSGLKSYYQVKNGISISLKQKHINSFELFQELEDNYRSGKDDGKTLIDVDFSKLNNVVLENLNVRFFWQEFFGQFISNFENVYSYEFKCCGVNNRHIFFLITRNLGDELFKELTQYSERFPYYRYFEEDDHLLTKDLSGVVKMVPASPFALHRFLETNGDLDSVIRRPLEYSNGNKMELL